MAARSGIDLADLPFSVFAASFLALFALVCVPLALTPLPPLLDYPNHLARMDLLAMISRSPLLQQFYAVTWRPVPDLAMDALVPPMLRLVSLATAGKLFLAAIYLALAGGVAALHRVLFRRWSAWPCLAFLLLYNRLLLWGFLNFLFALGLAFLALAVWIAWRERGVGLRLAFGFIAALTIYFAHLMAFGIYAAMLIGYEAGMLWRARKAPRAAARAPLVVLVPLLPPLVLFVSVFVPDLLMMQPASIGLSFTRPIRKLDLLFSVFDLYNRPVDVACFVLAVIGMSAAYWRRWVRFAPEAAVPLVLLALLYLVMPSSLFGANGADRRLPLAMALLLIGSSDWRSPALRVRHAFFAAAAVMLLVRLGMIAASWQASGRIYAELLPGLDALPPGARLAVAFPGDAINVEAAPLAHFPVLAIARRQAFVPTLFTYVSQQPVAFTQAALPLLDGFSADDLWAHFIDGEPFADPRAAAALSHYDYIAFAGKRPFTPRGGSGLRPVFVSPRFQIYRLPVPAP